MKTTLRLLSCSALLLLASCVALTASGSGDRPNSYQDVVAQPKQRDPYNHLDPVVATPSSPGPNNNGSQVCQRKCGPGEHCDTSGPVERCVSEESPK